MTILTQNLFVYRNVKLTYQENILSFDLVYNSIHWFKRKNELNLIMKHLNKVLKFQNDQESIVILIHFLKLLSFNLVLQNFQL